MIDDVRTNVTKPIAGTATQKKDAKCFAGTGGSVIHETKTNTQHYEHSPS